MFTNRVIKLLGNIGASNTDIALLSGGNASNISRLRTGARTPKKGSPTVARLVDGVYHYAERENTIPFLCALVNSSSGNEENIKRDIEEWLYDETEEDEPEDATDIYYIKRAMFRTEEQERKKERKRREKKEINSMFAERLDSVMNLLDLSNIRLARAVNIDPSQISRLRTGVRFPKANHALSDEICEFLFTKALSENRTEELAQLMDFSPQKLMNKTSYKSFNEWMFDTKKESSNLRIDSIFDAIDFTNTNDDAKKLRVDFEAVADTVRIDTRRI